MSDYSNNVFLQPAGQDVVISSLTVSNLLANEPIKTNGLKTLISTKLDISDTSDLQTELDTKDKLDFTFQNSVPNAPVGEVRLYSKSDKKLYIKDEIGIESALQTEVIGNKSTWKFSSDISGVPSSGFLRFNDTVPVNVSEIEINQTNFNGTNQRPLLQTLKSGDQIYVCDNTENCKLFNIISDPIDNTISFSYNVVLESENNTSNYTNNQFVKITLILQADTLQSVYDNSINGQIQLSTSKNFTIKAVDNSDLLKINGDINTVSVDGTINMNNNRITTLGAPVNPKDCVNKQYVDTEISNIPVVDLTDLENKTQNINLPETVAGTTDFTGLVNTDDLRISSSNIHLGQDAGGLNQGTFSVAIGNSAGIENQSDCHIAIGAFSRGTGENSMALGCNSDTSTFTNSIALGVNAINTDDKQLKIGSANFSLTIEQIEAGLDNRTDLGSSSKKFKDLYINNIYTEGLNMNDNKIINVDTPTDNNDAVNKSYVDTEISNIPPPVDLTVLENKTQNISTLTTAGNTKFTGINTFFTGSLGVNNQFTIAIGEPDDLLISPIFDTNGGNVNIRSQLNTNNIIASIPDSSDIGSTTNKFKDLYLSGAIKINDVNTLPVREINENVFCGTDVGFEVTTGDFNIGYGRSTLWHLSTGSVNVAFGNGALKELTTGNGNVSMGGLNSINTGSFNTAIGGGSACQITSAENSCYFGRFAGCNNQLFTGSQEGCLFLGTYSSPLTLTKDFNNVIAIGTECKNDEDNTCVIGNSSLLNIRPMTNNTCDLGSTSKKFKDLYLQNKIFGQGDAEIDLSTSDAIDIKGTNILVNGSPISGGVTSASAIIERVGNLSNYINLGTTNLNPLISSNNNTFDLLTTGVRQGGISIEIPSIPDTYGNYIATFTGNFTGQINNPVGGFLISLIVRKGTTNSIIDSVNNPLVNTPISLSANVSLSEGDEVWVQCRGLNQAVGLFSTSGYNLTVEKITTFNVARSLPIITGKLVNRITELENRLNELTNS